MRYYTDRPILRWEAATPDALAAAIDRRSNNRGVPSTSSSMRGRTSLFRAKFPALPAGALDWPPILEAGTSHRTRLWKLSDRDRFLRGESLNTIRLP